MLLKPHFRNVSPLRSSNSEDVLPRTGDLQQAGRAQSGPWSLRPAQAATAMAPFSSHISCRDGGLDNGKAAAA
jgi:hypothetical protein